MSERVSSDVAVPFECPVLPSSLRLFLPTAVGNTLSELISPHLVTVPLTDDAEYMQYLELFFVVSFEISTIRKAYGLEVIRGHVKAFVESSESSTAVSDPPTIQILITRFVELKERLLSLVRHRLYLLGDQVEKEEMEEEEEEEGEGVEEGEGKKSEETGGDVVADDDGDELMMDRKKKKETETALLGPRMWRLGRLLGLNEKEILGFGYVLISQAGSWFPVLDAKSISTVCSMSLYCNFTPKETLDFLAPNRAHIVDGLIEIESQYRDTFSSFVLKMPKACVHALVGSNLTSSEFLQIDKTFLAQVLKEEPNFKLFMDVAGAEGVDAVGGGDLDAELAMLEEEIRADDLEDEGEDPSGDGAAAGSEFDLYKFIEDTTKGELADRDRESEEQRLRREREEKLYAETDESFLTPYQNNVDYLDDRFQLLAARIRIRNTMLESRDEKDFRTKNRSSEAILRELRAKERMLVSKCEMRLRQTQQKGVFIPRLEMLAKKRNLCEFEKLVLIGLVGSVISHEVQLAYSSSYTTIKHDLTVGYILWILCDSLEGRIQRRVHFYRNAPLVDDGMVTIQDKLRTDLMDLQVDIDRRMLDFIVGLDVEFSEVVEGSNMYLPKVHLDNVVLPAEQKSLIVETVENFETFKKCRKRLGFDDIVSYGNSLVLLFYGESGTGKTMMANALANHLEKKLLLINFNSLGDQGGEVLRYIFRESKINDCLLFFDECEAFFETRKSVRSNVIPLLTQIEKHDGLIIMATNCACELDEAMHRRITLAIEFRPPDPVLRLQIWHKHFPRDICLAEDIDWAQLSMNYELTGGLIKNAVLSALSFAVAREGGVNPTITEDDLIKGARYQLRGIFTMNEFDRRIIPEHGLADVVLPEDQLVLLKEIISFEKARKVLFSQWGFHETSSLKGGTSILLFGPAGCGKTRAAEAIGFEVGCALKVIDLSEILSRYVYNTSKNIEKLFQETKKTGAILLIEITCVTSPQMKNSLVQVLSAIDNYSGIVILKTTLQGMISENFTSRFKFVLRFEDPNPKLRQELWRVLLPSKLPISDDVNVRRLALKYEFNGGSIQNVLFRAAARAALLPDGEKIVTHAMLDRACQEELNAARFKKSSMYQ